MKIWKHIGAKGLAGLRFIIFDNRKGRLPSVLLRGDYYDIKSQPITERFLVNPKCIINTFVIEPEEPCEGRLSSTVPWERKGEIPLRDPIIDD